MEKYMPTLETLETRLENYVHVNELQHQNMTDKNDLQHQNMMNKLDSMHSDILKDLMSNSKRLDIVEKETEKNKTARIWLVAISTFLAIVIPLLFGVLI